MRKASARLLPSALLGVVACGTVEEPRLPEPWGEELAGRPLSHADCVDLALRSTPNAAAWQARRLAAEAGLRAASHLPNPTLNASWEDFGVGGGAAVPVQQTFSIALALEALFSRGRREAAAGHDLAAAVADLRAEAARVEAEVRRDYDRLVAARARVELRRATREVVARQRDGLERFVAAGLEPRIAQQRADAELLQAQAEVAKAENEARLQEIALAFALGFARPVRLALADRMTTARAEPTPGLHELLTAASERRPELVSAQERYAAELERAHLQAERVRFLPTVAAGPRFESGDVRGVASLDVELPIFDGGGAGDAAQSAALLAGAAELKKQAQRIAGEVALAHARGEGARAAESAVAPLAAARRSLRERVERLFEAGEATFSDVIIARREAIDAELAALDASLAVAEAGIELDAAVGR